MAWDDVLWDLPSAVVRVCYLYSQPILGFKAVNRQLPISQNYCVNYQAVRKKKKKTPPDPNRRDPVCANPLSEVCVGVGWLDS